MIDDGSESGIRVTEYRQEEDPSHLAIKMAELMNDAVNHDKDYQTFVQAAMAERQKAMQIQNVIFQLKEQEVGGIKSTSRMDPLNTYDLDMCKEQLDNLKESALEFQKIAMDHADKASKARNEAELLQRKIRKLNATK